MHKKSLLLIDSFLNVCLSDLQLIILHTNHFIQAKEKTKTRVKDICQVRMQLNKGPLKPYPHAIP